MIAPRERRRAGQVLDRLPDGDPRPGVSASGLLWCEVPAGAFWQGEGKSTRTADLPAFWVSRYPVTNAQYAAFVSQTGRPPPSLWHGDQPPAGTGNHPVACVTWRDAIEYCEWTAARVRREPLTVWRFGRIVGRERVPHSWSVRLPTSAEWEKAARGGLLIPTSEGDELVENPFPRRVYPWGDSWHLSTIDAAGDEMRCNVSESGIGGTTPVGMYPDGASPYGLLDMAGNVWEWCLDWTDTEHRFRIRRGGAYRYAHDHARCAEYERAYPGLAWPYQGFRVVLGPPVAS
jgi:formylglycine-generating enzyme required for sulfatase activity